MCVYSFDYNERTGVSRRINNESKVFMIERVLVLESFTTMLANLEFANVTKVLPLLVNTCKTDRVKEVNSTLKTLLLKIKF